MSKISSLEELYIEQLKDLYDAEVQLTSALPKMAAAAQDPELKEIFASHWEETRDHVARLAEILSTLNQKPIGKHCSAIEELIRDSQAVMAENTEPLVKDVGLILAAQRIKHYEIAGYGCVRSYAAQLGYSLASSLLQTTLEEESQADSKLTVIAMRVNSSSPQHKQETVCSDNFSQNDGDENQESSTLLAYLTDMSAAELYMTTVLKLQEEDAHVQQHPEILSLISQIRATSESHQEELELFIQERGGATRNSLKQAVTSVTATATGLAAKIGTHTVSKMLRDDYATLSLKTIGYTVLHTNGLALRSSEVAAFALRALQDYTPLVMEINEQIIPVVVAELEENGSSVEFETTASALRNTQEAWKIHPEILS